MLSSGFSLTFNLRMMRNCRGDHVKAYRRVKKRHRRWEANRQFLGGVWRSALCETIRRIYSARETPRALNGAGQRYVFLFACLLLAAINIDARRAGGKRAWAPIGSLVCLTIVLVACGSSSGTGGNGGISPGSYNLTVKGTSQEISHTLALTLTVNSLAGSTACRGVHRLIIPSADIPRDDTPRRSQHGTSLGFNGRTPRILRKVQVSKREQT
jgi:hypothetical protein